MYVGNYPTIENQDMENSLLFLCCQSSSLTTISWQATERHSIPIDNSQSNIYNSDPQTAENSPGSQTLVAVSPELPRLFNNY